MTDARPTQQEVEATAEEIAAMRNSFPSGIANEYGWEPTVTEILMYRAGIAAERERWNALLSRHPRMTAQKLLQVIAIRSAAKGADDA